MTRDAESKRSLEATPEHVRNALDGDGQAVAALVAMMAPVVQARVARALLRRARVGNRDLKQDVADLTQDVFAALFSHDARALRSWEPERGLSLANFVGLLSERRVASILRDRRLAWSSEHASAEAMHDSLRADSQPADARAMSRQRLEKLLEALQSSLSARGLELFDRLYVQEQSVEEICTQTGLTAAAVHQWRHRLRDAARAALEELTPHAHAQPVDARDERGGAR